jgi:hypothetical protein
VPQFIIHLHGKKYTKKKISLATATNRSISIAASERAKGKEENIYEDLLYPTFEYYARAFVISHM